MSAVTLNAPTAPQALRPLLHRELDRLPDDALETVHKLLLEIELLQTLDEMDHAADAARSEGKLTMERISAAVATHRAKSRTA